LNPLNIINSFGDDSQLFVSTLSQILCKIRQPHHNNCQADNISKVNPAVKHPCKYHGKNSANDRSDNKNLELIQNYPFLKFETLNLGK